MARGFLPYDLDQQYLLPPSLKEWLPRSTWPFRLRCGRLLDLSAIMREYRKDELRGRPGYHPALLTSSSSTALPRARSPRANWSGPPTRSLPYRVLAGNSHPDHDSIASFRKRHLSALAGLFTQVLRLCQQAGLVKLGHVAHGSKLKARPPSTRP